MNEEKRQRKHSEAVKKGKEEARLRAMVARLARRPCRKKEKDEREVKTLVGIQNMKDTELTKVARMVMTCFDGTSRSIARSNVKRALKKRNDVVWTTGKMRSPILGGCRARKMVEGELKRCSSRMRSEEKNTIILEHQAVATATKSTLHLLNNTKPMSKKKSSELQ